MTEQDVPLGEPEGPGLERFWEGMRTFRFTAAELRAVLEDYTRAVSPSEMSAIIDGLKALQEGRSL